MTEKEDLTWRLLYDAECPTCTKFAGSIKRFDTGGRLCVESLQDFSGRDDSISMDELLEVVHLLGSDGTVLRGGEAVQMILLLAPQLKPLRWMIDSRWGARTSSIIYTSISHFRRCRNCGR